MHFDNLSNISLASSTNETKMLGLSAFHSILAAIPIFTIIFIIIVGNSLVIIAVSCDIKLRAQLHNWSIVSLAVADLLVGLRFYSAGLLVMPLTFIYEIYGEWILGSALCEIWLALDVLFVTASISNMCAISLDRYWSVTDPMHYPSQRSLKSVLKLVLAAWTIALAISLPPLFGWSRPESLNQRACSLSQDMYYVLYSSLGSFFIPVVVLLCVYTQIYMITRKRMRTKLKQVKAQEKTLNRTDSHSDESKRMVDQADEFSLTDDNSVLDNGTIESSSPPRREGRTSSVLSCHIISPSRRSKEAKKEKSPYRNKYRLKHRHKKLKDTGKAAGLHPHELLMQSAGDFADMTGIWIEPRESPRSEWRKSLSHMMGASKHQFMSLVTTGSTSPQQLPMVHLTKKTSPAPTIRQKSSSKLCPVVEGEEKRHFVHQIGPDNNRDFSTSPSNYPEITISHHETSDDDFRSISSSCLTTIFTKSTLSVSSFNSSINGGLEAESPKPAEHRKSTICCARDMMYMNGQKVKRREIRRTRSCRNVTVYRHSSDIRPVANVVFQQIKRKRREMKKQEIKSTLILGVLLGAFIFCWLPFFAMYILSPFKVEAPKLVFDIFFWFGYCNSGINPIIYTIFNMQFRRAFIKILKGIGNKS